VDGPFASERFICQLPDLCVFEVIVLVQVVDLELLLGRVETQSVDVLFFLLDDLVLATDVLSLVHVVVVQVLVLHHQLLFKIKSRSNRQSWRFGQWGQTSCQVELSKQLYCGASQRLVDFRVVV